MCRLTGWDDMRSAGPRLSAHAVGGVAEQRAVVPLGVVLEKAPSEDS